LVPVILGCVDGCPWKQVEGEFLRQAGFLAVCCSGGREEILWRCRQGTPCILVVDPGFFRTSDATELSGLVPFGREVRVLVTTPDLSPDAARRFLRMGCMGVVDARESALVFRRALRTVAEGELWASRRVLSAVVQELLSEQEADQVSPREREILRLIAEGRRNQEIADELFISRETVRWHLRHLYARIGVHDRGGAARWAAEHRIGIAR
jgi:DNA-binding NarL/FixJ family response regulator